MTAGHPSYVPFQELPLQVQTLMAKLDPAGSGAGDQVITVPNTFVATTEAISHTGTKRALVDCELQPYRTDPTAAALTPRTRASIPVHRYGQSVNQPAIAQKHRLALVADVAPIQVATVTDSLKAALAT